MAVLAHVKSAARARGWRGETTFHVDLKQTLIIYQGFAFINIKVNIPVGWWIKLQLAFASRQPQATERKECCLRFVTWFGSTTILSELRSKIYLFLQETFATVSCKQVFLPLLFKFMRWFVDWFFPNNVLVVLQKVRQKNQEMKVLMDQMRNLLWDVNAMLTLRK